MATSLTMIFAKMLLIDIIFPVLVRQIKKTSSLPWKGTNYDLTDYL